MNDINSITALIDAATVTLNNGHIVIKPLNQILEEQDLESIAAFDNIKLWENTSLDFTKTKTVLFHHNIWLNYEDCNRNLNFSGNDELNFQIKMHSLIKSVHGNFEGGKSFKISTLQNSVTYFSCLASFLRSRGIKSFHQLEFLPELKLRNILHDYLVKVIKIEAVKPTHSLTKLFIPYASYKLLGERTCSVFHETLNKLNAIYHKNTVYLSHPIIPSGILSSILKYSNAVISDSKDYIERWLELNNELVENIKEGSHAKNKTKICDIVKTYTDQLSNYEEFQDLCSFMDSLKLATYISILAYTGMRDLEVISCGIDCVNELDGDFSIQALMSKTDNTAVEMDWFCNKEVFEAVSLYQRYAQGMHLRAKALLSSYGDQISIKQKHNLVEGLKMGKLFGVSHSVSSISFSVGGRFKDFEVPNNKYSNLFNLTLTSDDIDELDRVESNYQTTRGKKRGEQYKEGDQFILGKHKFRHTLAYFVIANKLGELDDIRYQYKHLTSLMTFVYTQRATLAAKSLIEQVEGFEELLVNQIAGELTSQADNQALKGGAGEKFNKASKELVIGITDSNSTNSNALKQVHFKNLVELKLFIAKNLKDIRGLPHGYCTAGEACKIKGAAIPSGCVYCPSNIIAKRHQIHWQAILNSALNKLEKYKKLTAEQQSEYALFVTHWQDSVSAAQYVLNNTNSQAYEQSENR